MEIPYNLYLLPTLTSLTATNVSGVAIPSNEDFSRFYAIPTTASNLDYEKNWTPRETEEIYESLIDFATGNHKEFNSLEEFLADLHSE
jgi:hypothetical protein